MKTFFGVILAALVGTGCYTQVKSSGDYWGYTGKHQQERVEAVPPQQDSAAASDSSNYAGDQRSRDDEGYSYNDNYYNDNYYNAPNYDYYNAPYVSFSFGFGYHRPWWNLGYSSYYPYWYPSYYDPYWDWSYQPGFFSYGCLPPVYPICYQYYHSFYHPFYGEHFGYAHHGFFDGGRVSNSGVRRGRIGGGEDHGRVNTASVRNTNSSVSRTGLSSGRAATSTAPSRPNNPAVGRSNENPPARNTTVARGNGRSDNFMSTPRNNPRLIPQNIQQGRVAQSAVAPRSGSSATPRFARPYSAGPRSYGGTNGISSGSSRSEGRRANGVDGGSRANGGGGRSNGGSRAEEGRGR